MHREQVLQAGNSFEGKMYIAAGHDKPDPIGLSGKISGH
jgi:hypothetical protein